MRVKDLFKKDNVDCPNWLKNEFLEDDLKDSEYVFEDGLHKWSFKNDLKDILMTFDGSEFHFIGFDDDGELLLDNVITETYACDC